MADLTVVLKADAALKEKLKYFYQDNLCDKTPQYATFQAKVDDCTVTLYDSGKVMFQGKRAEEESEIWKALDTTDASSIKSSSIKAPTAPRKPANTSGGAVQAKVTPFPGGVPATNILPDTSFVDDTAVGSDEVGTGDFFGPIIVTASFVKKEQFEMLYALGVRDSKKITDDKITKIAPQIIEEIPHATIVLSNEEYNEMRGRGINMNQVKAILHNRCLHEMVNRPEIDAKLVVVDQFEGQQAYYNHLKDETDVVRDITFMTKAEDQCLAVACSSIISRFLFLQEMKRLGEELGYPEGLPFGAGSGVDAFGAELVETHGEGILTRVAKLNFANVQKVFSLL